MNCLEVNDLNVILGNKEVLKNVNFSLESNKIYSIVGPNGGGKTTLIKAVLNLISKSSGEIKIFGEPNDKYIKNNYVGYLPQNAQNFKKFPINVTDIVLMGLIREKKLLGFSKEQIKKALYALNVVNMGEYHKKLIYQLSGGQRQRVMIARAIVGKPKLLILDEPTTGLDVENQKQFYNLLEKLKKEMKMTIVMVTHDVGFVNSYTDSVICINKTIKSTKHHLECVPEFLSTKLYGYDVKLIEHSHERKN